MILLRKDSKDTSPPVDMIFIVGVQWVGFWIQV